MVSLCGSSLVWFSLEIYLKNSKSVTFRFSDDTIWVGKIETKLLNLKTTGNHVSVVNVATDTIQQGKLFIYMF